MTLQESTGPCADRVVGNARPSLLETTLSHMPAFNLPPLDVRKVSGLMPGARILILLQSALRPLITRFVPDFRGLASR